MVHIKTCLSLLSKPTHHPTFCSRSGTHVSFRFFILFPANKSFVDPKKCCSWTLFVAQSSPHNPSFHISANNVIHLDAINLVLAAPSNKLSLAKCLLLDCSACNSVATISSGYASTNSSASVEMRAKDNEAMLREDIVILVLSTSANIGGAFSTEITNVLSGAAGDNAPTPAGTFKTSSGWSPALAKGGGTTTKGFITNICCDSLVS